MAYVGTPLDTTNAFQSLAGKRFNGDGSTTDFTLDSSPNSTLDIEVFVGNVRQDPNSAYTVSGTTLAFTGAPPSGTNNIYVVHQAKAVGTIDPAVGSTLDLNGAAELILDADADTSITADTDDQIDIKIAGADDFQFTANTFTAQSGSTITTPTLGVVATKDLGNGIHIKSGDSGGDVHADADELVIEQAGAHVGMTFLNSGDNKQTINFGDAADNNVGQIEYDHDGNAMKLVTNQNERMRIHSDGNISIGRTTVDTTNAGISLEEAGTGAFVRSGGPCIIANRLADDGEIIRIVQAGTTEGTISTSGSTVSYNAFVGSHWSRLSDNSKPTILLGTVMDSISTMMTWYQAVADVAESTDSEGNVTPAHKIIESISLPDGKSVGDAVTFTSRGKEYTGVYVKEDNKRLPMCKVSDTEDSKAVYGVFMDWDNDDNNVNDMYVTSLGAYLVRIHKDETVAIGDYIQSKGDGTGKKQADDILRASTIGKVTSTEKVITHGDGSYCVPCTLHCG
jgi:hypothetical protein